MNSEEKEKIKKLREEGLGYTEIAKHMNISVNTIKSFCRRNGLGGMKNKDENISVCGYCVKPIKQIVGRKKKKFCSDKCRNIWWKNHRNLIKNKANYECTCVSCGKIFISYGNKNRKYCSHSCYIYDRFGSEQNADN